MVAYAVSAACGEAYGAAHAAENAVRIGGV
jgi:hypothetical protein